MVQEPASLADSLRGLSVNATKYERHQPTCGVALAAESLSKDDGEALLVALDNMSIPARVLALHLRDQAALHGRPALALNISTIYRHRRRASGSGCKCPVPA